MVSHMLAVCRGQGTVHSLILRSDSAGCTYSPSSPTGKWSQGMAASDLDLLNIRPYMYNTQKSTPSCSFYIHYDLSPRREIGKYAGGFNPGFPLHCTSPRVRAFDWSRGKLTNPQVNIYCVTAQFPHFEFSVPKSH